MAKGPGGALEPCGRSDPPGRHFLWLSKDGANQDAGPPAAGKR